jgi:hypothetical protein
MSRQAILFVWAEANNGMHPMPHHDASHEPCVGARVMPGVRRLIANHENEGLRVDSRAGENRSCLASGRGLIP